MDLPMHEPLLSRGKEESGRLILSMSARSNSLCFGGMFPSPSVCRGDIAHRLNRRLKQA